MKFDIYVFYYSKIREELGLKPLPLEKITSPKPVPRSKEKSRVSDFYQVQIL